MAKNRQLCPSPCDGRGALQPSRGKREVRVSLTILHLGAELALFGILKDRVVAGICALHGTVAAGLVKEGTIPTRGRAAKRASVKADLCR